MPTCPDCGQLCESPYHLQQHRMNCVMANRNLYNNTNNSNPNNRGNNTNNNNNRNSGGVTTPLPALNGNRYNNGNPNFYSPQSEIDQMLALQQARQEEERIQTERMLLEQQVNLVLPARQAELHQTQEYLKNQITQLKMNLLAQQQFAGQQNNMEVELLRNELAAVRNQLNALGGAATPPPGVSNSSFTPLPYNNSWPMQNNNNNNSPAPNEYGLKNVKSREPTKPTKSKANQRRKEKDTRRPKKDNRSARHRRRYEEDSPEEDYSDTEEDSYDDSDESEDSMDYDDLYDDYLPPRRHHRGRPSERRRSRTADHNGHDGRGDGRRSMSAGARSVESAPIARSKKNIYEFLNNVSPEGQADPLLSVLHSMKQELDALRGQQNDQMAVPFPTSSTLEPGNYALRLGTLHGLDLSIPLDDVEVTVKTYHLFFQAGEYVLDPRGDKLFPRNPVPLARAGSSLCVFTVPSVEFTVTESRQIFVFILQLSYRGTLLYWATVFARAMGAWTEGLRRGPLDIARALQSSDDMVRGATVNGSLEAVNTYSDDSQDILAQAERLLTSLNLPPGSINGMTSPRTHRNSKVSSSAKSPHESSPALKNHVQTPENSTTSEDEKVKSPEKEKEKEKEKGKERERKPSVIDQTPKPLPGLPALAPPPPGLPLLPGMPGNEGPFLPPRPSDVFLPYTAEEKPGKDVMPIPRFRLPPPPGVTALEWKERLERRIKLLDDYEKKKKMAPSPAPAPAPAPVPSYPQQQTQNHVNHNPPPPISQDHGESSMEDVDTSLPPAKKGGKKDSKVSVTSPGAGATETPVIGKNAAPPALVSTEDSSEKEERKERERKEKEEAEKREKEEKEKREKEKREKEEQERKEKEQKENEEKERKEKEAKEREEREKREQEEKEKREREERERSAPPPQRASGPTGTLTKVPKDDALRMRGELRPINDKNGNLAVPNMYKSVPNNPACVELDKFDVEAPAVGAPVVVGLADAADKFPPPKPPKNDLAQFFLDGVVGVPMDSMCCRICVYITDGTGPKDRINLHDPHVFIRPPDLVAYQDLNSSCIEPEFAAMHKVKIGPNTHAVCVVEYIVERQEEPVCLGHCCIPINKTSYTGSFLTRLKLGDPRRSQERDPEDGRPVGRVVDEQQRLTKNYEQQQLELSVDSQFLRNVLPANPRKRAECLPMSYLVWRVDNANPDAPYQEAPGQLPLSQAEIQVYNSRVPLPETTPSAKGIKNQKFATEEFIGPATAIGDGISYIAPYAPARGLFVRVEGCRGMGDDAAIYSVVCRLHTPQEGCPPKYTGMPDWMSDVGAPQYKDPPFLFPKLPFNQLTVFIFTLLKITNVHGTPKTQPIAWTITKAFMDDNNVARQGRFVLPWLDDGDCPEAILKRLHTERLDKVFISSLKDKSIQFHEPPSTVTISQGLPLLIPQLVDITAGSPQPRQLLMPGPMKKQFPSYTYEGQVGCTLITQNNMCFNGIVPQELLPRISREVEGYMKSVKSGTGSAVQSFREL